MVTCFGYSGGKYQICEHDPNVLLYFTGPDAEKFQQIDPPAEGDPATECVEFSLTVADCRELGFLPMVHLGNALERRRR